MDGEKSRSDQGVGSKTQLANRLELQGAKTNGKQKQERNDVSLEGGVPLSIITREFTSFQYEEN